MVSDNIRSVRKKKKLTQGQLAALIGVSQNAVHNWENGKRQPKLETLNKIAAALNISVIDLLDPEEIRKYFYTIPYADLFNGTELFTDEMFKDYLAQYLDHIAQDKSDSDNALSPSDLEALEHFRPLDDTNKDKAIDYMDYLKDRQDQDKK